MHFPLNFAVQALLLISLQTARLAKLSKDFEEFQHLDNEIAIGCQSSRLPELAVGDQSFFR